MKKVVAEPYRDFDFSARRGRSRSPEAGKTKISIRLITAFWITSVLPVEAAGGGNYQTLINDALRLHSSRVDAEGVRQVVREELVSIR